MWKMRLRRTLRLYSNLRTSFIDDDDDDSDSNKMHDILSGLRYGRVGKIA